MWRPAGMLSYVPDDEMLTKVLRRQNPWWVQDRGARRQPSVPKYVRSDLDITIERLGDRQIHALIGARQIGKTTMLMQLAARLAGEAGDPRRVMYASLDEPPFMSGLDYIRHALEWYVGEVVREPPDGIGERVYVMLDEIQEVDGWQGILKRWVDMGYNVKFIVSGSSCIGVLSGTSESLIGRMTYQEVMPLSFAQYASLKGLGHAARAGADMRRALARALAEGNAGAFHAAAKSAHADLAGRGDAFRARLSEYMVYGGRPGVGVEGDAGKKRRMLDEHIQFAVYKDIVRIGGVKDPSAIDTLLSMIAWKSPQAVNVSRLARDLGYDREETRHYLHLLKAAYLVQDAQLYSENPGVGARADKRVYIGDPGTRTAALRSLADDILADPAEAGRIAEAVVCDHALRLARSYDDVAGRHVYYWRSGGGDEVDAVVRIGGKTLPVESKYRKRAKKSDLRGISKFAERFGTRVGLVVSDEKMGISDGGIVTVPLWLYLLMC